MECQLGTGVISMSGKNWKNLTVRDFKKGVTEWDDDFTAKILVDGEEGVLVVLEDVGLTPEIVSFCSSCVEFWHERKSDIAKRTESYLSRFLPGRLIQPNELLLSDLEIDGSPDQPKRLTFRYSVGGDYSNPKYRLNEFDSSSTVELDIPIRKGSLLLEKAKVGTTNDFD
jgi:hypothetical protein